MLFGGGEAEDGAVVLEEFADQEDGVDGDDAIADEAGNVDCFGVALFFDEDIVPEGGELGVVFFEFVEQFILTLADFLQCAVFSDGFLDGQHERLKIKHYLLRSREARKWTSGFWIHAFR